MRHTLATLMLIANCCFVFCQQPSNPLLEPFSGFDETAPYDKITPEHFLPAIESRVKGAREILESIATNPAKPTFENTIVAIENAGTFLSQTRKLMLMLSTVIPEYKQLVKQTSPILTAYDNDLALHPVLFQRVKKVWESRLHITLSEEDKTLLDKTYRHFIRNGAALSGQDQTRLRTINEELNLLSIQFSENSLKESSAFTLQVTQEADLAGLSTNARETAKGAAGKHNLEGWVFTLQGPSLSSVLTTSENRDLREKLFIAYNSLGMKEGPYDNRKNVYQQVNLRYEKARLLGYKHWANYALEENMLTSVETIHQFSEKILKHASPLAESELAELTAYARKNGFKEESLQRWDFSFYSEKLMKEKYGVDTELLRPYFQLENVLAGFFEISNRLFGITFRENQKIVTWHPDVKVYEAYGEDGKYLGVLYGDFLARTGKPAIPSLRSIRGQQVLTDKPIRPHVVVFSNFPAPSASFPSLLGLAEVKTLFHEFGHALNALFSQCHYESISGNNVPRDYVELPSKMMENFALEPEVLKLFARHYQTQTPIPEEFITRTTHAANFMSGMKYMRQLGFGMTDMAWHDRNPENMTIERIEKQYDVLRKLFPEVNGTAFSTSFSHIFSGSYAAGYYSYRWSEVLDADAYQLFEEKGIFNKEVGHSFRDNILAKGGSENPMKLYKKFRGREPLITPMLKRTGLLTTGSP